MNVSSITANVQGFAFVAHAEPSNYKTSVRAMTQNPLLNAVPLCCGAILN